MKILLLGANGQVGWELQRSLSFLGELSVYDKATADFEHPTALASLVRNEMPDVIVNAAAYTAVDQAETNVETAYKVNAEAVISLAKAAEDINAWLIHYSTDYVFDGTKQDRYLEDDITNPKSVYGKSKRKGELAVINSGCKHLIFRTSWVFASRGNNFAKTMIQLARERDELKVVADQIGAPTSAELIADVTALVIYKLSTLGHFERSREFSPVDSGNDDISGTYHLTASGETSWYGFAKHIIAHAEKLGMEFKVKAENIEPITTEQFPRPAERPLNSRMDTEKLQSLLNIDLPDWQIHVDRMVTEFIENQS